MFKKTIFLFIITIFITSCSSIDIEEVMTLADENFNNHNFAEFTKQYNLILKNDSVEGVRYLEKIKKHEVFDIKNYETKNELNDAKELYHSIKLEVDVLADYIDEKIGEVTNKTDYLTYKTEINIILKKILNRLDRIESPLIGIYISTSTIDSLDSINKSLKDFEENISEVNFFMIELENLKVIEDEKDKFERLIESIDTYKQTLIEKESYLRENKVNIVAYNDAFMDGNILAVTKNVEHRGQIDKLTNNIRNAVRDLKQRIENFM